MSAPPRPAKPADDARPRTPHAARRLFIIYLALGLFFLACGALLVGWGSGFTLASPGLAIFGLLFTAIGLSGLITGPAVQLINRSLNLIGQGRLSEAERLLDEAQTSVRRGPNLRAILTQRAIIALRRGDVAAAERAADAAVTAPDGQLGTSIDRLHRLNARALRAFARASLGDREGAREDIAAVRASPDAPPQALGRAAVAEAILVEKSGDRAALREVLLRERTLLRECTDPRERAIVRAFQRMLKAQGTTVYRQSAPREPEVGAGEEPALTEWIARIAPAAAPFASAPRTAKGEPAPTPAPASAEAKRAVQAARAEAAAAMKPKVRQGIGRRLLTLLALSAVIFAFLVVGGPGSVPDPQPDPGDELAWVLSFFGRITAAVVIGGLVYFVVLIRRTQRDTARLRRAVLGIPTGDLAALRVIEEVSKGSLDVIGAEALLHLAIIAERAGDLTTALGHVEKGLGRLARYANQALSSDLLLPELSAERAFLLAAMGRGDEAAAEVEALNPAYPFLARARFRVRLMQLVRAGDLAAARLAAEGGLDLPLNARDELLADAVRVAVAPEAMGAAEVARVKDDLRLVPELRRWMEAVAPAVITAVERAPEVDAAEAS